MSKTPSPDEEMQVIKRNGTIEYIQFDKILNRIKKIGDETGIKINFTALVVKVIDQLYTRITTTKIDELLAEQCASLSSTHPDYNTLAAHIIISNHQKNTTESFSQTMKKLYEYVDKAGKHCPIVSQEYYSVVSKYAELFDNTCDYKRDYLIDYFGFKTLERSYLMKINKKPVERIQHMWMRVAIAIHGDNLEKVIETYHLISKKYFTHATPTLFNAGTNRQQLSSCFLISMESDSIEGIFSTLTDCAKISKWSGGIGLHIHNVRATGSLIRGTNGLSTGIVPMLKVFNNTAKYINQGGKRNGSFAIYLEPWHADIEDFLQMRKNHGDEELKARDLFYALWIPDLFMVRVKSAGTWTLMCPDECPGLPDVYGEEFEALYTKYEREGKGRKTIPARDLWIQILDAQMETGTPYMLYKDACNKKSNQKNIGTIKSSNLCVAPETKIFTDHGHLEIQSLCGQKVNIWNGEEYSEVEVFQTGTNQELIEVHTSDHCILHCTKYHKFFIYNRETNSKENIVKVDAQELIVGDILQDWKLPNSSSFLHKSDISVVKIVNNGRIDNTFCFTEPKRNAGIFNGIFCGNCCEIVQYSDENETAVCNLASIALPTFVNVEEKTIDYEKLKEITRVVTYNLNRVIDINYYPTEKTRKSNLKTRPVGLGVQGLADTFILLGLPFDSPEAAIINRDIFETIYYGALYESCQLALKHGPYECFQGSPASQGILQFDLWGIDPGNTRYDWASLKRLIQRHGLRNSLLVAPMPTASTSQILGYNECIEPITSNIYSRGTLSGDFVLANKYLMKDLIALGLWNEKIKNNIIANHGSIQHLDIIPVEIRNKYKTVWEIPMKVLINMAVDRGAFICQSQSLNLWVEDPNYTGLTSMHFYAWSKGLKTGIYYLRRRGRHEAQQFTVEPEKKTNNDAIEYQEDQPCETCSA
jgi:ribonucleotide reductase alpha subunit